MSNQPYTLFFYYGLSKIPGTCKKHAIDAFTAQLENSTKYCVHRTAKLKKSKLIIKSFDYLLKLTQPIEKIGEIALLVALPKTVGIAKQRKYIVCVQNI